MGSETEKKNKAVTCVFCFTEDFDAEEYLPLFTPLRRERLAVISFEPVRRASAAAELAYLAARKLAGLEGDASYSYAANGKPVMEGGFMSLSHSEGCAAASISVSPVGVDIEKLREINPKIASRALTEAERAELEMAEDRAAALLEYWTAKEACAKLTGKGLSAVSGAVFDRASGMVIDTASGIEYSVGRRRIELTGNGGEALLAVCTGEASEHIIAVFRDGETIAAFAGGAARN